MVGRWLTGMALLSSPAVAGAADDPFIGAWRYDAAQSTFATDPGIKYKQFVFAPTADGVLITETLEAVADHGARHHSSFPYAYNKATPETGSSSFDTLFVTKADARTAWWTELAKGRVVAQLEVAVSPDDKRMTFRYVWNEGDPAGKTFNDRYVYVRE